MTSFHHQRRNGDIVEDARSRSFNNSIMEKDLGRLKKKLEEEKNALMKQAEVDKNGKRTN
jgi:hypothetical protein